MNRGARGNASGFHLSNLNRIADTKSNINQNMTLLHYIIDTLEKKFKDVLKLEEDIHHVRLAAKVKFKFLLATLWVKILTRIIKVCINQKHVMMPSCPICLHISTAAKMCGHVFCSPSILLYLALTDKSWQKCSICFEAVHKMDLKRECSR
nr:uncharacterized protein LOC122272507 isoform X2 [Parasteatoda tepidariorum]XP_042912214.1 uncharacterized protein LOC122272507 isoform X2 [Parasteatoda tepidariorum]XP_042912215.1 uncharacterized protein LOC122272507 isoform X2 [Parasteatoda tepidariorum]XP_042912216.1 uncharacterized protein LOC122272507 isoform X2 [Parasteatoda tepidariorum]